MTLNEYQQQAMTTCMKASENFSYMMLNLVGEVGELASKVAKHVRKGQVRFDEDGDISFDGSVAVSDSEQYNDLLRKEAGDVLWQLAGLCYVMGWPLERVAEENLQKLASRQQRGVIDGNGDER